MPFREFGYPSFIISIFAVDHLVMNGYNPHGVCFDPADRVQNGVQSGWLSADPGWLTAC
ncbi:MAG: hypothetical protein HC769_26950 [Cyanobacteria bacterium CRU_2_1]|nr:hypothetical protein [Cyanobacteria bacterium RU_5_0]NJR62141.1 hypothetical protein [Cyanobacteria bacterium CRU_2_1]